MDTDEQDNADELHNTMEYTTFIHYNAQGQRCPVNTTSYYKPNYVPLLPNPSSQPCLTPGGKHGMRSIAYRNKRKRIKQELQMSRNTLPSDTNSSMEIQKSGCRCDGDCHEAAGSCNTARQGLAALR